MKLSKYIFGAAALVSGLFVSCTDDSYDAPSDIADVSWYVTADTFDDNSSAPILYTVQDKYLSFMDMSQGTTSHQWSIHRVDEYTHQQVQEHAYLITEELSASSQKNLEDYVNWTAPTTTDAKTVIVYFDKYGEYKVRLKNTFDQEANYLYDLAGQTYRAYTPWSDEDKAYVMDTTFTVHCYGPKLFPRAKVYLDAECTQEVPVGFMPNTQAERDSIDALIEAGTYETGPQIEVEFGNSLYFKDYTENFATSTVFTSSKNVVSQVSDSVYKIEFNKLYDKYIKEDPDNAISLVKMAVSRTLPEGSAAASVVANIGVQADTIPFSVKVINSTKPLVALSAEQLDNNRLRLVTSYLLDEESLADVKDVLSIKVTNDFNGCNVVDKPIAVTETSLDPTDDRAMIIELDEMVFNTDQISLVYTPTAETGIWAYSKTQLIDEASVNAVEVQTLQLTDSGVFGFEDDDCMAYAGNGWNNTYAWFDWAHCCDRITDNPAEGKYCAVLDTDLGTKTTGYFSCREKMTISGSIGYLISFKIRVAADTDPGMFNFYVWDVSKNQWWTGTSYEMRLTNDVTESTPLVDDSGYQYGTQIPYSTDWVEASFNYIPRLAGGGGNVPLGESNANLGLHIKIQKKDTLLPSGGPIYVDDIRVNEVRPNEDL